MLGELHGLLKIEIYLTGKKEEGGMGRVVDGGEGGGGGGGWVVRKGRPVVGEVLDGCEVEGENSGVLVCAPKGLLFEVQRACVDRDVDVHMEEFAW